MQEVEAGRNIAYGQVMQRVGHQVPDPQAHDTQYQHLINQGATARIVPGKSSLGRLRYRRFIRHSNQTIAEPDAALPLLDGTSGQLKPGLMTPAAPSLADRSGERRVGRECESAC